jgi:hypothetical protein
MHGTVDVRLGYYLMQNGNATSDVLPSLSNHVVLVRERGPGWCCFHKIKGTSAPRRTQTVSPTVTSECPRPMGPYLVLNRHRPPHAAVQIKLHSTIRSFLRRSCALLLQYLQSFGCLVRFPAVSIAWKALAKPTLSPVHGLPAKVSHG